MTLYHYTTAAGLQGIVHTKSLWTTDYRFLDDTTECQVGWSIVQAALRRREAELKEASTFAWNTIESLSRYSSPDNVHAFVGSLTSESDLLSQWRGYNRG